MRISSRHLCWEHLRAQWFIQILSCLCLVGGLAAVGLAQSGGSILPNDLYNFSGDVGANATVAPITVGGKPFTQGYRVTVNGTSANSEDAALRFRTAQAVAQGDNLQ